MTEAFLPDLNRGQGRKALPDHHPGQDRDRSPTEQLAYRNDVLTQLRNTYGDKAFRWPESDDAIPEATLIQTRREQPRRRIGVDGPTDVDFPRRGPIPPDQLTGMGLQLIEVGEITTDEPGSLAVDYESVQGRLHGNINRIGLNKANELVIHFDDNRVAFLNNKFADPNIIEGVEPSMKDFSVLRIQRDENGVDTIILSDNAKRLKNNILEMPLHEFIASLNDAQTIRADEKGDFRTKVTKPINWDHVSENVIAAATGIGGGSALATVTFGAMDNSPKSIILGAVELGVLAAVSPIVRAVGRLRGARPESSTSTPSGTVSPQETHIPSVTIDSPTSTEAPPVVDKGSSPIEVPPPAPAKEKKGWFDWLGGRKKEPAPATTPAVSPAKPEPPAFIAEVLSTDDDPRVREKEAAERIAQERLKAESSKTPETERTINPAIRQNHWYIHEGKAYRSTTVNAQENYVELTGDDSIPQRVSFSEITVHEDVLDKPWQPLYVEAKWFVKMSDGFADFIRQDPSITDAQTALSKIDLFVAKVPEARFPSDLNYKLDPYEQANLAFRMIQALKEKNRLPVPDLRTAMSPTQLAVMYDVVKNSRPDYSQQQLNDLFTGLSTPLTELYGALEPLVQTAETSSSVEIKEKLDQIMEHTTRIQADQENETTIVTKENDSFRESVADPTQFDIVDISNAPPGQSRAEAISKRLHQMANKAFPTTLPITQPGNKDGSYIIQIGTVRADNSGAVNLPTYEPLALQITCNTEPARASLLELLSKAQTRDAVFARLNQEVNNARPATPTEQFGDYFFTPRERLTATLEELQKDYRQHDAAVTAQLALTLQEQVAGEYSPHRLLVTSDQLRYVLDRTSQAATPHEVLKARVEEILANTLAEEAERERKQREKQESALPTRLGPGTTRTMSDGVDFMVTQARGNEVSGARLESELAIQLRTKEELYDALAAKALEELEQRSKGESPPSLIDPEKFKQAREDKVKQMLGLPHITPLLTTILDNQPDLNAEQVLIAAGIPLPKKGYTFTLEDKTYIITDANDVVITSTGPVKIITMPRSKFDDLKAPAKNPAPTPPPPPPTPETTFEAEAVEIDPRIAEIQEKIRTLNNFTEMNDDTWDQQRQKIADELSDTLATLTTGNVTSEILTPMILSTTTFVDTFADNETKVETYMLGPSRKIVADRLALTNPPLILPAEAVTKLNTMLAVFVQENEIAYFKADTETNKQRADAVVDYMLLFYHKPESLDTAEAKPDSKDKDTESAQKAEKANDHSQVDQEALANIKSHAESINWIDEGTGFNESLTTRGKGDDKLRTIANELLRTDVPQISEYISANTTRYPWFVVLEYSHQLDTHSIVVAERGNGNRYGPAGAAMFTMTDAFDPALLLYAQTQEAVNNQRITGKYESETIPSFEEATRDILIAITNGKEKIQIPGTPIETTATIYQTLSVLPQSVFGQYQWASFMSNHETKRDKALISGVIPENLNPVERSIPQQRTPGTTLLSDSERKQFTETFSSLVPAVDMLTTYAFLRARGYDDTYLDALTCKNTTAIDMQTLLTAIKNDPEFGEKLTALKARYDQEITTDPKRAQNAIIELFSQQSVPQKGLTKITDVKPEPETTTEPITKEQPLSLRQIQEKLKTSENQTETVTVSTNTIADLLRDNNFSFSDNPQEFIDELRVRLQDNALVLTGEIRVSGQATHIETTLTVDKISGKLVQSREPVIIPSSGIIDRRLLENLPHIPDKLTEAFHNRVLGWEIEGFRIEDGKVETVLKKKMTPEKKKDNLTPLSLDTNPENIQDFLNLAGPIMVEEGTRISQDKPGRIWLGHTYQPQVLPEFINQLGIDPIKGLVFSTRDDAAIGVIGTTVIDSQGKPYAIKEILGQNEGSYGVRVTKRKIWLTPLSSGDTSTPKQESKVLDVDIFLNSLNNGELKIPPKPQGTKKPADESPIIKNKEKQRTFEEIVSNVVAHITEAEKYTLQSNVMIATKDTAQQNGFHVETSKSIKRIGSNDLIDTQTVVDGRRNPETIATYNFHLTFGLEAPSTDTMRNYDTGEGRLFVLSRANPDGTVVIQGGGNIDQERANEVRSGAVPTLFTLVLDDVTAAHEFLSLLQNYPIDTLYQVFDHIKKPNEQNPYLALATHSRERPINQIYMGTVENGQVVHATRRNYDQNRQSWSQTPLTIPSY